jgi:hypothetical protein
VHHGISRIRVNQTTINAFGRNLDDLNNEGKQFWQKKLRNNYQFSSLIDEDKHWG